MAVAKVVSAYVVFLLSSVFGATCFGSIPASVFSLEGVRHSGRPFMCVSHSVFIILSMASRRMYPLFRGFLFFYGAFLLRLFFGFCGF